MSVQNTIKDPTDGKGHISGMVFLGESKKGRAFFHDPKTGTVVMRKENGDTQPFTKKAVWDAGTSDQSKKIIAIPADEEHAKAQANAVAEKVKAEQDSRPLTEPTDGKGKAKYMPFAEFLGETADRKPVFRNGSQLLIRHSGDDLTEHATLPSAYGDIGEHRSIIARPSHAFAIQERERLELERKQKAAKDHVAAQIAAGIPADQASRLQSAGIDPQKYQPVENRYHSAQHEPVENAVNYPHRKIIGIMDSKSPAYLEKFIHHSPVDSDEFKLAEKRLRELEISGEGDNTEFTYDQSHGREMRPKTTTWAEHKAWRATPGRIHHVEGEGGKWNPDSETRTIKIKPKGAEINGVGTVVTHRNLNGRVEYLLKPFTKTEAAANQHRQNLVKYESLRRIASNENSMLNVGGQIDAEMAELAKKIAEWESKNSKK